ncbi:protocadherin gamma-A10-like [Penaeus chinensis]|uniref:protocadherin gamma-A10-like n=1 Tax=Penaeus chinensis TaxID=139456 RepID=UPI001FB6D369|nr:protocadherin gamma-A10-like [Penaeus chinensis]
MGNGESVRSQVQGSMLEPHQGFSEIRTTGRQLDREQHAEHMLEVTIRDGEDPATSLSSVAFVAVNVLDENDHAPAFLESLYKFSVPILPRPPTHKDTEYVEDMPIGRVVAVDEDEDDNGDITYSIEGDQWLGTFKIHNKTGIISAKPGLNPEEDYEFTVQAIDNGRPRTPAPAWW